MRKNDFDFDLPEHLIAQRPTERRGQSRLLLLDKRSGAREHRMVEDLPEILCGPRFALEAGPPLLVFNNSKVLKARLPGADLRSGARAEFLLLEKAGDSGRVWKALAQKAKRRRPGSEYALFDPQGKEAARARVLPAQDGESGAFGGETRLLEFDREIDDEWLEANGRVPLPPYIKRSDEPEDARRYQTVYARAPGSAAAPTAGLHFTDDLLGRLARAG
ncbi:MAG: S-adenosylmethionine:tRNA ribosyltransferase-isomerase, partial [Treponema sp.]|nr:S-adenosylmethionine:tRNA ribosyltransferase-isomerase [Treponema sp.]